MELSAAFATSPDTPEHIRVAEALGYARAWCYDSPALYPDVWMILALAAERTMTIGLGPAVLVPALRHPMTNAAAIATLAHLAPGRTNVAIGSGFTGRYVLGKRAMRWADVDTYVGVLKALLRGEQAEWDGAVIQMIHPPGFVADRPVDVTFLIGADGPKGLEVAKRHGDGVFSAATPTTDPDAPAWRALLTFGTVLLDASEQPTDERVITAAGHAMAVAYHALYERGGAQAVDALPGGAIWREAIEQLPEGQRHLAIHEDHLVATTERDRAALDAGGAALLPAVSFTGTPQQLRHRAEQLAAAGVTEIAYQPGGPDIPGELERMRDALAG